MIVIYTIDGRIVSVLELEPTIAEADVKSLLDQKLKALAEDTPSVFDKLQEQPERN